MNIIGKTFQVEFAMAKARLAIESETSLTFSILEKNGDRANTTETVSIKLTEIRPALFLVTWKEASGTTVTQVHDHETGVIYSNWTTPEGQFTNVRGTIKEA
jgi:hypothetical protein